MHARITNTVVGQYSMHPLRHSLYYFATYSPLPMPPTSYALNFLLPPSPTLPFPTVHNAFLASSPYSAKLPNSMSRLRTRNQGLVPASIRGKRHYRVAMRLMTPSLGVPLIPISTPLASQET